MPSATEDKLLGGRYRLGEPLGRGGMGVVWAGRDEALGRQVAIKEVSLPVDLPADDREKLRRRTLREARAAARISSPAAVTVYDVVEEDGRPWIVMERLVARSLADVLREEGPLPASRVAEVGLDVLSALEAAASVGVLHRDVKPANVMLRSTGRAVLTDFGIARVEGDATVTTTGLLLGSPAYMSPERARGEPSTLASDLWSLGATLYAALDGRSPFERSGSLPTLNAVLHDPAPPLVPGTELGDLINALLAKEPARRPSPLDVRAALLGILARPKEVPSTSGSVESAAGRDGTGQGAIESWLKSPDDHPSTTGRSQDRHVLLGLLTVAILFAVALVGLGVYLDGWRAPESASPQAESGRGGSEAPAAVESPQPTADAAVNQPPAGGPVIGDRPSPTNQPSEPAGTSADNAGPAAAPLPDGYQLHTDPTGFTVAVPTGWTRSVEGPRTYFKEPGGGRFLLVDQTTEPKDDPLTDWQANEPSVADRLSGYERISLDRVEYRGWNTADWEFTWDARNGQIHVLNRNVRVSDARAYALYWSIPESQWADSRGMFDVIAQSFQPAPG